MTCATLNQHRAQMAAIQARAALELAGGVGTCADLARRWGISKARAHALCQLDGFPEPVAQAGRSPVYLVCEADEWLTNRRALHPNGNNGGTP